MSELRHGTSEQSTKIAILGFGAVGSFVGWRLQQAKIQFSCFGPSAQLTSPTRLEVLGHSYEVCLGTENRGFGLVWVCCRANELESAMNHAMQISTEDAVIITLCNGLVEPELLAYQVRCPSRRIRVGSVSHGISNIGPRAYRLTSTSGEVTWGPVRITDQSHPALIEQIIMERNADFHFDREAVWVCRRKWLVSSVLNSVCAIHDLNRNADALAFSSEIQSLFEEVFQLGQEIFGSWKWDRDTMWNYLMQLIAQTRANTNSMVRDLRAGRKTEIEYTLGLVRARTGFPQIRSAYQQILSLERN